MGNPYFQKIAARHNFTNLQKDKKDLKKDDEIVKRVNPEGPVDKKMSQRFGSLQRKRNDKSTNQKENDDTQLPEVNDLTSEMLAKGREKPLIRVLKQNQKGSHPTGSINKCNSERGGMGSFGHSNGPIRGGKYGKKWWNGKWSAIANLSAIDRLYSEKKFLKSPVHPAILRLD